MKCLILPQTHLPDTIKNKNKKNIIYLVSVEEEEVKNTFFSDF